MFTPVLSTTSASVSVNASVAELSLVENPAAVALRTIVVAGLDALALVERTAALNVATGVLAGVDGLTLAEYPAALNVALNIAAGVDALSVLGFDVSIVFGSGVDVQAETDVLALAPKVVGIFSAAHVAGAARLGRRQLEERRPGAALNARPSAVLESRAEGSPDDLRARQVSAGRRT